MRARIKKTGEVVSIADYATIALDIHDSWGNPIEMKPEELELIQEQTNDEHWQDVRERAAIAAMQGTLCILPDCATILDKIPNEIAEFAVACADALIEELKKKKDGNKF